MDNVDDSEKMYIGEGDNARLFPSPELHCVGTGANGRGRGYEGRRWGAQENEVSKTVAKALLHVASTLEIKFYFHPSRMVLIHSLD